MAMVFEVYVCSANITIKASKTVVGQCKGMDRAELE